MAINIATKAILKILSFGGIDVEVSRQLADLKRLDPMKIFYKKMADKKSALIMCKSFLHLKKVGIGIISNINIFTYYPI